MVHVERPEQVDVHDLAPEVRVCVHEWFEQIPTCIVDQDVDWSELRCHPIDGSMLLPMIAGALYAGQRSTWVPDLPPVTPEEERPATSSDPMGMERETLVVLERLADPLASDADELLLVRQYRHGTEAMSLEIPGGLVDPGEQPEAAAGRELREETGFEASSLQPIGVMTPNPAIFSNRCHTYLATGCRRVGDPDLDPGEDLEVVVVPAGDVDAMVRAGEIDHALVLAALAFWRARV